MKIKETIKNFKIINVLIMFLSLFTLFPYSFSHVSLNAESSVNVKVGWFQSENFQNGLENEEKSGYSYEYLQKIANYNTWSYEYVYGDWTELFDKLKTGEIDILAGVSKTSEREAYLAFPNYEMGNEAYYIYQHSNNKTMSVSDLSSFNGKKIGAIEENRMSYYLEQWNNNQNANLNIVYYNSFEKRDEAFANNELDGIVIADNNVSKESGYSVVTKVGEDPYYLAVSKKRSDLLETLNKSLSLIVETDPYYLQNLQYSFFGSKLTNFSKTELEENWIANHETLIIGYLENYLPYSATDSNGNVKGLITDVVNAMLYELDLDDSLTVSYIAYPNYESMISALKNETIDTAFPIGGNAWDLEQDDIDATNSVIAAGMNLVYKDNYNLYDNGSFAINKNNKLQYYYIKDNFPDSKLVEYNSIDECLNAVLNGDTKYTIINGLRVNIYADNDKYNSLSSIQLQKKDYRYFGVNNNNIGLLLLLDRGINLIGSEFAINASYSYIENNNNVDVASFIRKYSSHLQFLVLIIAIIIILLFVLYIRKSRRTQKIIKDNLEENKMLTSKLEQNNIELNEKAMEAQKANEAKTTFLNNMSHDIRTPMNAILGFTDLIEKKKEDPKAVEDYVRKIKTSGDYLLSIINNVLDMARIESGKVEISEELVDLLAEESTALSTIQEMAKKKKQTFAMYNSIKHNYVLADIQKLKEIMMNLISNAIKYTPEGGYIEMDMDEYESAKEGYGKYVLTVKDNGLGMSKEFIEHIFDSFSRERNTTESKVIGTGLGMSIVKNLVDLLGGTIEVESELHKGSTFKVTFEHKIVDDPNEFIKKEPLNANSLKSFNGKRILVVEDNDFNAEITIAILENAGFNVDRACDGIECIKALYHCDADYYAAVLMDIQMPNLNGYQATKNIRLLADKEKANIPIIAMTANAFEEDKKKALEAGMNAHLAKPVDVNLLIETLSNIIK